MNRNLLSDVLLFVSQIAFTLWYTFMNISKGQKEVFVVKEKIGNSFGFPLEAYYQFAIDNHIQFGWNISGVLVNLVIYVFVSLFIFICFKWFAGKSS